MKWGVRRFQNKDGTLTNAGKKRYDETPTNNPTNNKRYNKVYAKYKTEGYDDVEAAKLTKGQLKTEKILIGIGAVAITGVAATVAYKHYDNVVDRMISSKHAMQTVHKGDAAERLKAGNPFFATYKKADNTIYASKVFSHFTDKSNVTKFYTDDGIKVASRKTGARVLDELVRNNNELKQFIETDKMLSKYASNPKKRYDMFNKHLVLRGETNDKMHKIFYDALKERGYGAVMDINDSKLEGFTFNPVIVFDNQVKHIISSTPATKEHLGVKRLTKAAALSTTRKVINNPLYSPDVKQMALIGAGSSIITSIQANDFVERYKNQHPNTKLSDWQLTTMYINQKQK